MKDLIQSTKMLSDQFTTEINSCNDEINSLRNRLLNSSDANLNEVNKLKKGSDFQYVLFLLNC